MDNKWLEMSISVPDEAVDLVSQSLVELGSSGIKSAELDLDTFEAPDPKLLAHDSTLRAYFPWPDDPAQLCEKVQQALHRLEMFFPDIANSQISFCELENQQWATDWRQHFSPFRVGKHLIIKPSWETCDVAPGDVILTLDPGQAFGTGTHATTNLCLDAMSAHFSNVPPPNSILDVGTGSGILAMAGAALGATNITATDIDEDACEIARSNITSNHLDDKIVVTSSTLEKISGQYDLVLANILAAENIRLADQLFKRLSPSGRLVLSGILIEQEPDVLERFRLLPLNLLTTLHRDEWTCIVYQNHE